MNREEKEAKVGELHEAMARAKFAVVSDFRGLKVTEVEKLRRSLRQVDSEIRIAKNTLFRLAVKGTAYEALNEQFSGTSALTIGYSDPVSVAKAITDFKKESPNLVIRSAVLGSSMLGEHEVEALSKLPDKDTMRAMFLGVLNAVPTGFVRVLNAVPQSLVYALQAIKEQKEQ